ncbi:MAG: NAD(+) synthase [Clostridiales bacterium]|nr:NAD(+) synthase [Clostridiales bacterium]
MTKQNVQQIIDWIKEYFNKNSFAKGVVLGMSGGKDSLVVAKLCTLALGKEKVFGVIMPNGKMKDINDAIVTCQLLGIDYDIVDIESSYNDIITKTKEILEKRGKTLTDVSTINTAPRLRMTTLYAVAGSMGYLVANTSNLSERMVGYSTKWGDSVGDFAPIANFTKNEVCEIGLLLGLPVNLVTKTPSDGLSGKSDEDKLGITYDSLDNIIRTGTKNNDYEKILRMYKNSTHKRGSIPAPSSNMNNFLEELTRE